MFTSSGIFVHNKMCCYFVGQTREKAERQTGGRKSLRRRGRRTATPATTSTATTPPPCSTKATVFTTPTLGCSAHIRPTHRRLPPTRICCRNRTARRSASRSITMHPTPTASTLPSQRRCPCIPDRGLPPEQPDRRTRSTLTGTSGLPRWPVDTGRDPRHHPRDLIMVCI
jgi:hypothetical protein